MTVPMSCFGRTRGITNYPNVFINNKFQNFPRPNFTYKPHTEAYLFIHKNGFLNLFSISMLTSFNFLCYISMIKREKTNTLNDFIYLKTYIPEDFHICNFFYTYGCCWGYDMIWLTFQPTFWFRWYNHSTISCCW